MGSFLNRHLDFKRHNEEVDRVWAAFRRGEPYRVPVTVAGSIRNLFGNPEINRTGYTFEDFFNDPKAHLECQLAYRKWVNYNLLCDAKLGPPEAGWPVTVDFQNSYEAMWFGCPLRCDGNQVPDTQPILQAEKKRLYDLEPPDPLRGNRLGRAMDFFEYLQAECPKREFEGRPVRPPESIPGEGTDGPFSIAYKLRGAAEACLDICEDPQYFHDLMNFVTENSIRRMK
ncbi:MAG TPA: uroporphyrinogen decarboxylase family protein, partial [bacterium]|nr:uroporphyrinogen decarboxylase family protein [bacterium]